MNDSGNITIGLLVVTAVILTSMLVGTFFQTAQPVLAEGPARSGNYIVASGRWNVNVDITWIINVAARQLNIYYANHKTDSIELIDTVDLEQAFAAQ